MLLKRLFLGVLLLTPLLLITGCAAISKPQDPSSIQYSNASDECLRRGLRRGSYEYQDCMDKILESRKKDLTPEQD